MIFRLFEILKKNVSETSDGLILSIRVDSDPSENYLVIEEGELVFRTREYGNTNRVNSALVGFLSQSLKIPSSRIDIVYGARTNGVKRVLIRDMRLEDLEHKLLRVIRLI